jgi:ketosteroid isomerase-like protein
MTKKNIHITHREDKTWAVIGAGDSRASSIHRTQGEAIEAGKPLAIKNQSELVIHGRDNKIVNSNSYGNDPNPPKDTKH